MTVNQLIEALQQMPPRAVVLFESDTGYALIGNLDLQKNSGGLPDEVILLPDMSE
jgi:hypothetical protein